MDVLGHFLEQALMDFLLSQQGAERCLLLLLGIASNAESLAREIVGEANGIMRVQFSELGSLTYNKKLTPRVGENKIVELQGYTTFGRGQLEVARRLTERFRARVLRERRREAPIALNSLDAKASFEVARQNLGLMQHLYNITS